MYGSIYENLKMSQNWPLIIHSLALVAFTLRFYRFSVDFRGDTSDTKGLKLNFIAQEIL